jgi:hypothetical protein
VYRAARQPTPRPPPDEPARARRVRPAARRHAHEAWPPCPPDGLRQLDSADTELRGGIRQTERGGRHVATGRLDRPQLLRARRPTSVHVGEVVRVLAERDAGLATGFLGRDTFQAACQKKWRGVLPPARPGPCSRMSTTLESVARCRSDAGSPNGRRHRLG